MNSRRSFDHLVGGGEQLRMEFEAERLGGTKVDHEFESGGLHHRQVGRLLALENPPYVETGLAEGSGYAAAVRHQATGVGVLARCVHRGDRLKSINDLPWRAPASV
jgi:hypothetical protein